MLTCRPAVQIREQIIRFRGRTHERFIKQVQNCSSFSYSLQDKQHIQWVATYSKIVLMKFLEFAHSRMKFAICGRYEQCRRNLISRPALPRRAQGIFNRIHPNQS